MTSSQRGSALLPVMISVLVVGLIAASVANMASTGAQQSVADSDMRAMLSIVQTLGTVAGANESCLGVAGLDGLKFRDASGAYGNDKFALATASDAVNGQDISIGTQLQNAGANFIVKAAQTYAPLNLTIDQLAYRNVKQVIGTNTYNGEVILKATMNVGTPQVHALAPRSVGKLSITVNSGILTACSYIQSGQIACEAMNCKYNAAATKQKCTCGFPPVTCPSAAGEPRAYISGLDESVSPPAAVCTTYKADCSDPASGGKGQGFFFTGFDNSGDPICVAVEGQVSP